jgi:hypothetical protein
MEFLLQWMDDLDDALGALRHLAPRILGFLLAVGLFVGTCFTVLRIPQLALVLIALVLSASLVEVYRRRRLRAAREGAG